MAQPAQHILLAALVAAEWASSRRHWAAVVAFSRVAVER